MKMEKRDKYYVATALRYFIEYKTKSGIYREAVIDVAYVSGSDILDETARRNIIYYVLKKGGVVTNIREIEEYDR
jgi:hypothetical protein